MVLNCGTILTQVSILCTIVAGFPSVQSNTIAIPGMYKALIAEKTGESFEEVAKIQDLPIPTLDEDEVLINVRYAGVNGGCETFRSRGEFAFAGNAKSLEPFKLGAEGVGVVEKVGSNVKNVSIGDAVCFLGSAFAEYSKCKASTVWVIPSPDPEYVGLRISALTACAMLEITGNLRQGETVLITAAAGGAGHFAVQFAKLAGCTVIGTCGSSTKVETLKKLGCDHIINYKQQDVNTELKKLAPNGLDAILEGVGGKMLKVALNNLSSEGRLLQVGYISEYPHNSKAKEESSMHDLDASELFWKSKTIQRGKQTIYGNAWPKDFGVVSAKKDRVLDLFAEKKLVSLVDHTEEFNGLDSISNAVEFMLSGKSIGKVVVKIQ